MKPTSPHDTPRNKFLLVNSMDPLTIAAEWFSSCSCPAKPRRRGCSIETPSLSANLQAIINGILGDSLAAADHPLAIPMTFRVNGQPLILEHHALTASVPDITGKLIVLIHGLCMHDLQWPESTVTDNSLETLPDCSPPQKGNDLCLSQGHNCIYLHYNTGHHISTNGQELGQLLETLIDQWPQPVTELVIIGNSMGGLVARSACHYSELAGHRWLSLLKKLIFVGVPHHGSHWERLGNWVDIKLASNRCTSRLADLAKIRSAGITDLRYGYLLDSHWEGRDRFAPIDDTPQPVPLPREVTCYTIAATLGKHESNLRTRLMGDGVVPLDSALGRHLEPELCLAFGQPYQSVFYRMHHLQLLRHPLAFEQIKAWLGLAATNSIERHPGAVPTEKSLE